MLQSNMYVYFLSLTLLLCTFSRSLAVIVDGPKTTSAQAEEWASFNCSVECSHSVKWAVEIFPTDISHRCEDGSFSDACTTTLEDCSTSMSTSDHLEQLRIRAPTTHIGQMIAVQCVALSKTFTVAGCAQFVEYTRVAYLNVNAPPTIEPTEVITTSEEPETEPEPETETVVVTQVVTPSPVVVVHTVTSTASVLVTVNSPECTPGAPTPANVSSGVRRLHLSTLLKELFTWLCTLVAALAFL